MSSPAEVRSILEDFLDDLNDKVDTHRLEELLKGELGRIRDVATGPDGHLYLLTDAPNGGLFRLEPAE